MVASKMPSSFTRSHLQVLLYVCSLIKSTIPFIENPLRYAATVAKRHGLRRKLQVRRISLQRLRQLDLNAVCVEPDLNACIYISSRNAALIGLRSGQWCEVNFHIRYANHLEMSIERWAIVVASPVLEEEECLMSPIFYHNLQRGNSIQNAEVEIRTEDSVSLSEDLKRIFMIWNGAHGVSISTESGVMRPASPENAAEVQIKLVESVKYKCGSSFENPLKYHFRTSKAVQQGDVLAIPILSHLRHDFETGDSIIPPKFLFIKITKLKGPNGTESKQTLLVSTDHSKLYMTGSVHSPVPPLVNSFDSSGAPDIPPLLKSSYCELRNIIGLELRNKSQELRSIETRNKTQKEIKKALKGKSKPSPPSSILSLADNGSVTDRSAGDMMTVAKGKEEGFLGNSTILLLGPPGCGSELLVNTVASALDLDVIWKDAWHIKGDTSGGTEARLRQTFVRAVAQAPCVLGLLNVHSLAKDRDGTEDARVVAAMKEEVAKLTSINPPVFVVGTAPQRTVISDDLWSIWSHQESIDTPDLAKRHVILEWLFSKWLLPHHTQTLAQRTAGFVLGDFNALHRAASRFCLARIASETPTPVPASGSNRRNGKLVEQSLPLVYADFTQALDELQTNRSEALGAPRIPQVRWSEVGGLEEAKRQVINTIQLPLRHPTLVSSNLRRSGVLLYGPPGTGKTLLAKAVATECGLNFMSVKGPELLNMYVGQSEENVRQVFSKARAAAPCVIFFDELDSLAPNRGRSGDSGGVMDRIVSALLAELDGVSSAAEVFVLAATNRPDLIDPALLRPGRFEKLVFLGVCEDRTSQVNILRAITSKMPLGSHVSLETVSEMLPLTLTGADLYALCTDALYTALHRTTQQISEGLAEEENATIVVEEVDFQVAADQLMPSVTAQELKHYHSLNTNKMKR